MSLRWMFAALALSTGVAMAAQPDTTVRAQGPADGAAPAWSIDTIAPPGWTKDCCTYARAIGVNYVLYQGEWTGKPDRVMVLNVWPSKLDSLDAELQDDQKHYLQADPAGKVSPFPLRNGHQPCLGVMYSGSDHLDDVVVFCDPGKTAGVRFSWSMTVGASDPLRQSLLDAFKHVVEQSRYSKDVPAAGATGKPH
ncbi:hypothetical protein [Dyella mobilis]|uniref:Uncharacterized protein n=1 Tax=Dyella mobilis TaxID=1849582 RepID=A0ABS2KGA2_9GAMM|nr:hypothetical protein [Dyella mobilis]MBM7130181.1 hypothetical protein [Dyella mobilis]GLQ96807.1 hypothetical protein GCM10007863_12270 [Dyella mobilis]